MCRAMSRDVLCVCACRPSQSLIEHIRYRWRGAPYPSSAPLVRVAIQRGPPVPVRVLSVQRQPIAPHSKHVDGRDVRRRGPKPFLLSLAAAPVDERLCGQVASRPMFGRAGPRRGGTSHRVTGHGPVTFGPAVRHCLRSRDTALSVEEFGEGLPTPRQQAHLIEKRLELRGAQPQQLLDRRAGELLHELRCKVREPCALELSRNRRWRALPRWRWRGGDPRTWRRLGDSSASGLWEWRHSQALHAPAVPVRRHPASCV